MGGWGLVLDHVGSCGLNDSSDETIRFERKKNCYGLVVVKISSVPFSEQCNAGCCYDTSERYKLSLM